MGKSHPCKHCKYPRLRLLMVMKNVERHICPRCHKINLISKEIEKVSVCPPDKTCFMVYNHQGKANAYAKALSERNYFQKPSSTHTANLIGVKFVLTDSDILHRVRNLEKARVKAGVERFFVYGHAARPNLFNDIYPAYPHTTAQFVAAEGHVEIKRRFGYPKPLHVVGWHLCPILPFVPRENPRNILFAPIHPRNADIDKKVNRAAFERLAKLAIEDAIHLTVRYITDLGLSGLDYVQHKNIEYIQGDLYNGPSSDEMTLRADLVVGHQTFAWKAAAMGVPTLMMGEQENPTHIMTNPIRFVNSWDKYKDLLCFPLDILCEDDTMALIKRAANSDEEIRLWKSRMIGKPFDPQLFVSTIESYL